MINCTFFGNKAYQGGGIEIINGDQTMTNCILWNDKPDEIHNGGYYTTIKHSCIQGGYPGNGNIDSDPLFVDPAKGDLHLTFLSPCKDAGKNSASTELTDFEGDPRIMYSTVDMGADEFYTHLYFTGDLIPGGNVDIKFVGYPGTAPVYLWAGSGVLENPIPTSWGEWWNAWWLQFPVIGPIDLGMIPTQMTLPKSNRVIQPGNSILVFFQDLTL